MRKFNWTPAKENDRQIREAAPEMYEALKKALFAINAFWPTDPPENEMGASEDRAIAQIRQQARAALAKADGKPTRSPAPDQPATRQEPS